MSADHIIGCEELELIETIGVGYAGKVRENCTVHTRKCGVDLSQTWQQCQKSAV